LPPVNGNLASNPDNPLFLLDESLTPAVAKALALVGYSFMTVEDVFGQRGATDPQIIDWCQDTDAVWVHADDRARKQHGKLLQTSGIRTLWVYRKRGRMSGKEQLRILAFVLPHLAEELKNRPRSRHFRASATNDLAKPTLRPVAIS